MISHTMFNIDDNMLDKYESDKDIKIISNKDAERLRDFFLDATSELNYAIIESNKNKRAYTISISSMKFGPYINIGVDSK